MVFSKFCDDPTTMVRVGECNHCTSQGFEVVDLPEEQKKVILDELRKWEDNKKIRRLIK